MLQIDEVPNSYILFKFQDSLFEAISLNPG